MKVAVHDAGEVGGVTVSYFEWVQTLQDLLRGKDVIGDWLTRILTAAFNKVASYGLSEELKQK